MAKYPTVGSGGGRGGLFAVNDVEDEEDDDEDDDDDNEELLVDVTPDVELLDGVVVRLRFVGNEHCELL